VLPEGLFARLPKKNQLPVPGFLRFPRNGGLPSAVPAALPGGIAAGGGVP